MNLYPEVESIVLAMWEEPEEEMALEASSRLSISYEQALELVNIAIQNELDSFKDIDESEEWADFDPDC